MLLDLTTIRALGGYPVAVVAGVNAQDAERVRARAPVDAGTIAAQFDALDGVPIGAFCVGALLDAPSVHAVAAGLGRYPGVPVICDPVIAASGGDRLADDATIAAMRAVLFRRCTLLTPNLAEAALLTGTPIADLPAMRAALPALLGRRFTRRAPQGRPSQRRCVRSVCRRHPTAGVERGAHSARPARHRFAFGVRDRGALCVRGRICPMRSTLRANSVRECIERGGTLAGMRIAFHGETSARE